MGRFEFTGIEEYDELFDSLLFGVFVLLSIFADAFILLSVSQNTALRDNLMFFQPMVLAGIIFFIMADRKEDIGARKILLWSGLCFIGLLGIAFVSNIVTVTVGLVHADQLSILPNYLELAFIGTLGLGFSGLFSTLYFVAMGEEILKGIGMGLFNVFQPIDEIFGINLPEGMVFQPLAWIIVLCWAIAHVFAGQNVWYYCFPVFFDGIWLLFGAQKGGSWLVPVLAHSANNVFFQGLIMMHVI